MPKIKPILDEWGVILEAQRKLPDERHRLQFLEALAELQNNDSYVQRQFPKTRLHRLSGVDQAVYRADVDKISGWRIHVQLLDGKLHLKDLVPGEEHDRAAGAVKTRKVRYS